MVDGKTSALAQHTTVHSGLDIYTIEAEPGLGSLRGRELAHFASRVTDLILLGPTRNSDQRERDGEQLNRDPSSVRSHHALFDEAKQRQGSHPNPLSIRWVRRLPAYQ